MNTIYTTIIYFYYYIILLASSYNPKAKKWIKGRKNWIAALAKKIDPKSNWIWFHCSSLGEFEDCCEIFFKMQKEFPSKKTILTVFSPSAFETLKTTSQFDAVAYLPLDTKRNAKAFIEIVNPELVLFSRAELWLNILQEVRAREIPLFLISLKMSTKSNFIKWPFKYFYRNCFKTFRHIYCQNHETLLLLHAHFSITNSEVTGNTRFERVNKQSQTCTTLPDIEKFASEGPVVVFGSCLPKDERYFIEIYDELKPLRIKWVIVPHELEKSNISRKMNSKNVLLYSNIEVMNNHHDILIIDTVGILKNIYRYARFALIGGGFDKIGIHNVIEPAVHGVQVAFGPNHRNYEEAIQLLKLGGASIFHNSDELKELIKSKLQNPENLVLKEKIKQFVKANALNNSKIIESIKAKLNN